MGRRSTSPPTARNMNDVDTPTYDYREPWWARPSTRLVAGILALFFGGTFVAV